MVEVLKSINTGTVTVNVTNIWDSSYIISIYIWPTVTVIMQDSTRRFEVTLIFLDFKFVKMKKLKVSWKFYFIYNHPKYNYNHQKHGKFSLQKLTVLTIFFLFFVISHNDLDCAGNSASNCDGEVEFERLTFLSKVENRLKRGENLCENFTRGDILNFQEMSG